MNRILAVILGLLFVGSVAVGQGGLAGRRFCIDPGHGGNNPANDRLVIPDPGVEFWESESNFQKALHLDTLLRNQGAFVILTRYTNSYPNDNDEPTLSQRVAIANANNVHWFHSIHSNAANGVANYTLLLARESTTTPGQPESPQAYQMCQIMAPRLYAHLRTTSQQSRLDFSFLGFRLGVLSGLVMPGQLSEGSFHDVFPETRRLLNQSYRKLEAYALRNSFMQYYSVPADTLGIVAGIQTEVGTGRTVNFTQVRLLPENVVFNGDRFNNGFYMFDRVIPGVHKVRFETIGYLVDSATVNIAAGATHFVDKGLDPSAFPTIVSTVPAEGDTGYAYNQSVLINFSKPMATSSVDSAFSIQPVATGVKRWSNNNLSFEFDPDSLLPAQVNFTVRVEATARAASGQLLDGDGNGTPGDPFVLRFRTRSVDAFPPQIIASYPGPDAVLATPSQVLNITFDERLNPATVTAGNLAIQRIGAGLIPLTAQYSEANGRGGINLFPASTLISGQSYRVRVSGVADLSGNAIPAAAPVIWQFSVASAPYQNTAIEPFDTSVANWWQPGASGSTAGIDSASFAFSPTVFVQGIPSNSGSGQLRFFWNTAAGSWLIREYLGGGTPRSILWRKENTFLQAYVHGDGGKSQFRFAIDDSVDAFPNGRSENHEVSRWFAVDWVGWRFVEWDLERDSIGIWLGNQRLEGQLRFDSFQMRYVPGMSLPSGQVFFDQLQVAHRTPQAVKPEPRTIPAVLALQQNFPNPFNPATTIHFAVPSEQRIVLRVFDLLGREVATLTDGVLQRGAYSIVLDGSSLASGVYLYRLEGEGKALSRKLVLMK